MKPLSHKWILVVCTSDLLLPMFWKLTVNCQFRCNQKGPCYWCCIQCKQQWACENKDSCKALHCSDWQYSIQTMVRFCCLFFVMYIVFHSLTHPLLAQSKGGGGGKNTYLWASRVFPLIQGLFTGFSSFPLSAKPNKLYAKTNKHETW